MHAEILSVGTELLMGQIVNTNAQYISQRLLETGIGVYHQSVVGDNAERLKEALTCAMKRADVVVLTGGLGPTSDDITKETTAETLGEKLVFDKITLKEIENFFKEKNRKMPGNNLKQALVPEGCIVIRNRNGTAPGCIIEHDDKVVVLLPGPPGEMEPMFEDHVIPFFRNRMPYKLVSVYLRIFGIGESSLEEKIIDIIEKQDNPTIAPYAKAGEVALRITAKCGRDEDPYRLINPMVDKIMERIGGFVYSTENKNMEQVLAELLSKRNITLSIAESCTGGLMAKKLTDISGISRVFKGSVVAYCNEVKKQVLQVGSETLDRYGAVSREVAREMAIGVRELTDSDIGVSISGIAGPTGDTPEKPIGLVFIGISDKKTEKILELKLWGERDRIRNVATLNALNFTREYILATSFAKQED